MASNLDEAYLIRARGFKMPASGGKGCTEQDSHKGLCLVAILGHGVTLVNSKAKQVDRCVSLCLCSWTQQKCTERLKSGSSPFPAKNCTRKSPGAPLAILS